MSRAGDIERIAVFRALMLGDMLCAQPALRALRCAWPQAEITLIGLPWAQALAERWPCVDRFVAFPGHPGLPESPAADDQLPMFLAAMRAQHFDLALQMHGNGTITNGIVASLGARRTAAFVTDDAPTHDVPIAVRWPEHGQEIERCLALVDRLGLPRRGLHLELPLRDDERHDAAVLAGTRPYAIVHPGARWPSRRWPVERFAAVADALAERGLAIAITGSAAEAPIAHALAAAMQHPAVDLTGRTSLWVLGALVERAQLVVCNDTGISHVAAATGTRSVVVACGSDVSRWAPLDGERHRVLWAGVPCRPCGHEHCPTAHECALAVDADAAISAAHHLLSLASNPWPVACASSPGTSTATTSTT
jgi:ADP-heptose:LPS heptosyltransferase